MPRYWITTHWPPYESGGPDTLNIYIQDKYRRYFESLGPGDRVFVYQFKTGPDLTDENGRVIHRRTKGEEAVVCEARVATPLHARPGYVPERFKDKGKRDFRWQALTDQRVAGRIPRRSVNKVLGYEDGNAFFGFNGGRGMKEISSDQYTELHALLAMHPIALDQVRSRDR